MSKQSTLLNKLESLFRLKLFAFIISLLIMLSGIVGVVVGTIRLYAGVIELSNLHKGQPGIHLIEAVDTYLFSIVIFILGGGIFKLFVGNENTFSNSTVFSKIKTFMDLKVLLWETLLLTLTVWCSLSFFAHSNKASYEQLILPVSILLLALALKFVKSGNH